MAELHVVSALRNKRVKSAGMFVLDIELTCQHALAFDFVAEGSDGQQIRPQRQLVPGKQGARGDREIVSIRLAAPAQAQEHVLDPAVRHTHDLGGAERKCRCG
jgi:hypothetical protein